MIQSAIATAADYADAMITARRAKNILFGIILVMLLVQMALFLAARFWIDLGGPTADQATASSARMLHWIDKLKYLVGLIDFLGVAAPVLLAVVLLLLTAIMLVGRLVGVSHLVSAFLWCVVLILLLFPWQAFLINQTFTSPEFKFAGVLYNWHEVVDRARLHPSGAAMMLSFWGRFIVAPVIALILLLTIQAQSRRGLRLAFGEGIAPTAPDTAISA
jgi:hypothetical protein